MIMYKNLIIMHLKIQTDAAHREGVCCLCQWWTSIEGEWWAERLFPPATNDTSKQYFQTIYMLITNQFQIYKYNILNVIMLTNKVHMHENPKNYLILPHFCPFFKYITTKHNHINIVKNCNFIFVNHIFKPFQLLFALHSTFKMSLSLIKLQ